MLDLNGRWFGFFFEDMFVVVSAFIGPPLDLFFTATITNSTLALAPPAPTPRLERAQRASEHQGGRRS